MFDIVSFGSATVDIFVNTGLAEKNKKISYPVGSKILLKSLKFDIGGGGTNTAVAFSRLGLKTGYIGKIGEKSKEKILSLLKKEKVKFLGKAEKGISGHSIILDSKENNRTILTYKGINNNLTLKEIKIPKTKWLYFSSLLGKSFESQKKLAKKMEKTKLAFNPSEYLIKKENILPLLKLTSILILNKQEAELILKEKKKIKKLLKNLHRLGPEIIVITDKNKKVMAYDSKNNKFYSEKPHKIKVKERTGAGDAFAAGFVAGIIEGKKVKESLKLGIKEAEAVIRYFGAKNNLLKRK